MLPHRLRHGKSKPLAQGALQNHVGYRLKCIDLACTNLRWIREQVDVRIVRDHLADLPVHAWGFRIVVRHECADESELQIRDCAFGETIRLNRLAVVLPRVEPPYLCDE